VPTKTFQDRPYVTLFGLAKTQIAISRRFGRGLSSVSYPGLRVWWLFAGDREIEEDDIGRDHFSLSQCHCGVHHALQLAEIARPRMGQKSVCRFGAQPNDRLVLRRARAGDLSRHETAEIVGPVGE